MTPNDTDQILHRLGLQDAKLDRIEKKVDKTNGRVNVLEAEKDRREGYEQRLREEAEEAEKHTTTRRWWVQVITSPLTSVLLFVAGIVAGIAFGSPV